jgi:hypothetical protein
MSGKISLALLASASCLCFASEAFAIDASPTAEPTVIYGREPAPVRMASAERSNMGGGFIEFLFGDAPQGGRYQQAPAYQTQPDYGYGGRRALLPPMDPQQSMRREEERSIPRSVRSIRNTKSRWSSITARKARAPS